jgi:hypothetical protein
MKGLVGNTVAWVAATGTAVTLAFGAPSDIAVMGRLPPLHATHMQRPMLVPQALPAERTLALVAFRHSQASEVQAWIDGLRLHRDPSIAWVRMPVLNDPGDAAGRSALENRLMARYPAPRERANLVPVFTDRAAFIRSAGLESIDQVYAIVLNRQGEVLARIAGPFDEGKAQTLRETLAGHSGLPL